MLDVGRSMFISFFSDQTVRWWIVSDVAGLHEGAAPDDIVFTHNHVEPGNAVVPNKAFCLFQSAAAVDIADIRAQAPG